MTDGGLMMIDVQRMTIDPSIDGKRSIGIFHSHRSSMILKYQIQQITQLNIITLYYKLC